MVRRDQWEFIQGEIASKRHSQLPIHLSYSKPSRKTARDSSVKASGGYTGNGTVFHLEGERVDGKSMKESYLRLTGSFCNAWTVLITHRHPLKDRKAMDQWGCGVWIGIERQKARLRSVQCYTSCVISQQPSLYAKIKVMALLWQI